jgi:hypothetical protein
MATSLYTTSVFTSLSGAAYEAVTSLRNGSRYTEKGSFQQPPLNTRSAGPLTKLFTEAALVVIVIGGAIEWPFRALLYVIAKVFSYCLPSGLDFSANASRGLMISTNATAGAAFSLITNLCGSGMAIRTEAGNSVRKVVGFVTCYLCAKPI